MTIEPSPQQTGRFSSSGLSLAYEVHGDAPLTLVFLPGVGFSRVCFRPIARYLARHVRCVLVDARGTGESEAPEGDDAYALARQSDDVIALLDHLEIERVVIVGHSFGANVGVDVALRAPSRVQGIALLSVALAAELIDAALQVAGDDPDRLKVDVPAALAPAMRQWPAPGDALWGREGHHRLTGKMREIDQRDKVATLPMPWLALVGARDPISATSLPLLRDLLPPARCLLLDEAGHHPHIEAPERSADEIARFLQQAVLTPPASATPPLRVTVTLVEQEDGVVVDDQLTGFSFALGESEAAILRGLGGALPELARAVDVAEDDVASFIEQLRALGLLSEGLSAAEIEGRQAMARRASRDEERFEAVLNAIRFAFDRVSLHRQRMSAAGVTPDDLAEESDLGRIPPMTKDVLRAHFPDGLVPDGVDVASLLRDGKIVVGATSGSTAERLQVLFDASAGGLPEASHSLWGLDDDVELSSGAVFTSPICAGFECHLGMTSKAARTRGSTLTLNSCDDPFAISDEEVRAIAAEMREYQPRVLFVNPWYAVVLLRRVRALALTLPDVDVVLASYQYLTRRHRQLLRQGFRAPVFSYYGATDLGGALIGVECHRGSMHVREDHVHLEIEALGGDDDSLGWVTVTTLSSPHMPLVRYRVGDLARPTPEPCPCEQGGEWRSFILEGRARDTLQSTGRRTVTTRMIDDAIGEDGPDFYRLVQEGGDRFRLETLSGADEAHAIGAALSRLPRVLGEGARIRAVTVKQFSPERSLKFRQTVREDSA